MDDGGFIAAPEAGLPREAGLDAVFIKAAIEKREQSLRGGLW